MQYEKNPEPKFMKFLYKIIRNQSHFPCTSSFDEQRLGVEYIDLMLLHHPLNNYIAGYQMMEKAYKEGKIKALGLSNFKVEQIQEILDICEIKPVVMQIECHPYYPAEKVKDFCFEKGIII